MSVYRVGGNKSSQNVFPSVRPTLDLDFANSKTLDPRITFTRASGGSYVGADGLIKYAGVNEARFDHDPSSGESLGLLIEEGRTNSLLRSEEFNSVSWVSLRASISPNVILSPDGNLTADKLVENTATDNHFTRQATSTTLLDNTVYTFSVYAKAAERTTLCLVVRTKTNQFPTSYFNLINGTVGGTSGGMTTTIQNVGNGWYRCSVSQNMQSGATNPEFFILTSTGTSIQNYTGDGTSGIYIWGAQLEEGSFPTSYIPTQASTRTRAVDSALITGKNFSDWYRQDEGTVVTSFRSPVPTSLSVAAAISNFDDGTANNRFSPCFYVSNSRIVAANQLTSGVTNYTITGASGLDLKNTQRAATALSFGNYGMSVNGLAPVTNSSAVALPTVNTFRFGIRPGGVQANGTISRLTYFPKRLPNEQLIALTR